MMTRKILILALLFQTSLLAQSKPKNILDKTFIQFKWSNDFVYDTDYYYTNGFAFEVMGPWAKGNPINSILIPSTSKSINQFGVTLTQDIFTPQEKYNVEEQLKGDRPFAAYMLLGFIKKSFNPERNIKIISEVQVGVLGPAALGKETQDGIHDMLPTSKRLNGWENQISNTLAINYSIEVYKSLFSLRWFNLYGSAKGKLGIPFTHLEIGSSIRLGWFGLYPQGFESFSKRNWTAYFFVEAFGRIVGYNATMQGGLFNTSIYTLSDINNFLVNYKLGVTFGYKLFTLELASTYNSPEFPEALSHKWAYAIIRVGF